MCYSTQTVLYIVFLKLPGQSLRQVHCTELFNNQFDFLHYTLEIMSLNDIFKYSPEWVTDLLQIHQGLPMKHNAM